MNEGEGRSKTWIPILLLLIAVGGVGVYLVAGNGDEQSKTEKTSKQGKSKRTKSGKKKAGDVNVNATYEEKYEASAAVTGKYGLSDDDVSDVEVNGNSAKVTLTNGTVVPVTLKDGEWVPSAPQGELPSQPQAQTPEVEQPSQPQVSQPQTPQVQQPQVQTPSAPG